MIFFKLSYYNFGKAIKMPNTTLANCEFMGSNLTEADFKLSLTSVKINFKLIVDRY